MRISRSSEGVFAKCYRAKCGKRAFISSLPTARMVSDKRKFTPKYFTAPLTDPPGEILQYIDDMYEITPEELRYFGVKYCEERASLYMPIRDIRGYEIGGQTKALIKNTKYPKAITYFHNDVVKCHFALPMNGSWSDTAVVVEDILSSIKLSRIAPACALLSHDMIDEVANLLASNFRNVVVMLDPDATKAALRTKRKYSLLFRNFYVIVLDADPKDTKMEVLSKKLGNFLQ